MRTVDAPCLQAAAQAPSKACLQMRTQLLAIASTEKSPLESSITKSNQQGVKHTL